MGRRLNLGLILMLLTSVGCGSGEGTPLGPADAEAEHRSGIMSEVGELVVLCKANTKKPPAKVEDLSRFQVGFPRGYEALKQGDIVLEWGAPTAEGVTDKVLAYEKVAPESGGYVLMQDGFTVKKLTADEFKAAPKAAK